MTAETSRIRKIGRSYYVKISNQFEELNLDVGDEVQVIVTSVNHVKLANAASDDDSLGGETLPNNELNFPLIAWQVVSGLAPGMKYGVEDIVNRISRDPSIPESRIPDVLKFLVDSKNLNSNGTEYWRRV